MELINVSDLQIVSLKDIDLEKALFRSAYYSHLVPKKIMGKDGVERIHWVSPEVGEKHKLKLVHHTNDGEKDAHHKIIKESHDIDADNLVDYQKGDVLKITRKSAGTEKGTEGVFKGSVTADKNSTPRIAVLIKDEKLGKEKTQYVNVNNVELAGRATDASKGKIKRKTVQAFNAKGEAVWVDPEDYKQYFEGKTAETKVSPQQKYILESKNVVVGDVYIRDDKKQFQVLHIKDGIAQVKLKNPAAGETDTGEIEVEALQTLIGEGKYYRHIYPTFSRYYDVDKTMVDPITKEKKIVKVETETKKKNTWNLEAGFFHRGKDIDFDEHGHPKIVNIGAVSAVVTENWPLVETTVDKVLAKYPTVNLGDMTGADFYEGVMKAVSTYNPFLGRAAGGIRARIAMHVTGLASAKAKQLHEENKLLHSGDSDGMGRDDDGGPSDRTVVDHADMDELTGDESLAGGGFIDKSDALMLEEGIREEADLVDWHYDDPEVADIVKRWTGLGVFESDMNMEEAAAALEGKAWSPVTMLPYKGSTIRADLLPDERQRIVHIVKNEIDMHPEFQRGVLQNFRLRDKLKRKRKIGETSEKDLPTIKAVRVKHDGGHKAKTRLSSEFLSMGVPLEHIPLVVQITEGIINGRIKSEQYESVVPHGGGPGKPSYVTEIETALKDLVPKGKPLPENYRIAAVIKTKQIARSELASVAQKRRLAIKRKLEAKVTI